MPMSMVETRGEASIALERAREHLLSLQDAAGWWRGELQTNVTMDAEDILLREFLGIRTAEETERSAAWIRSRQREDGTWSNFYGGPGDLSTTVEAYFALRLAGDPADTPHMRTAAARVREAGGLEEARVFTHVWLALFGLWPWERLPALPPEIVLPGRRAPLSIYDFGCWARQTIVALSLVIARRPLHELDFDLRDLHGPRPWTERRPAVGGGPFSPGAWLLRADRALRLYERRPPRLPRLPRPLRRAAISRAQEWIVRRQEADGSWGGIQPPWVYSLIALRLGGYPLDHPVMRKGIEGLDRFIVEDRGGGSSAVAGALGISEAAGVPEAAGIPDAPTVPRRRLEACQSPVWDTALAAVALGDAGLGRDHPALLRAAEWLLAEEVRTRGDWAHARPDLAPGGWAFEFENDNYPDVDDTAEVVLALLRTIELEPEQARRAGRRRRRDREVQAGEGEDGYRERTQDAIDRAVEWVEGMQSEGGGWAAFDADNTRTLVREIPFLDFGEVIDPPSSDVTAHVLEMLAAVGRADGEAARAGLKWLCGQQEPDGSWFGRWGVNHVYGTGAAVPALIAVGVPPEDSRIRRAVEWLQEHQNEDGGWGEDPRSYDDPAWIGRGPSTASQTSWALLALHAAGERIESSEAIERGVAWLAATQREDGSWEEPQYTGTGFPRDYYINYHLYRLTFPVTALGRCLGAGAGV
jgi:squalene-hopene/tetraprenyl-beta-curcumene cyclase